MPTANVYIDGFNLYYTIKQTPYKWLDLSRLCSLLLSGYTISRIRYFTARVQARPGDPALPQRQDAYWRALTAISTIDICEGQFKSRPARMPLLTPAAGVPPHKWTIATSPPLTMWVLRTEEKGSDVNLAAFLLWDSLYSNEYEAAVVVTNDSDLATPIDLVRRKGHDAIVLNPHP